MLQPDRAQLTTATVTALVLFDIYEIQWCLNKGSEVEKQAALAIAMNRGLPGIRLVIQALHAPNCTIVQTALALLQPCCEPEAQQAIWNYLGLPTDSNAEDDYKTLQQLLGAAQWQAADELTCAIVLAMVHRQGRWLRETDLPRLNLTGLEILDRLWRFYSGDRFGFTVQAQIWQACEQEECSPLAYSTRDLSYCFGQRVGWTVRAYDVRYLYQYDFKRKSKTPYALSAPIGNLPSTFALGGGEEQLEFEQGDIESTMGFYADDRYYYSWSKDALFGHDLLRRFFILLSPLCDRTSPL